MTLVNGWKNYVWRSISWSFSFSEIYDQRYVTSQKSEDFICTICTIFFLFKHGFRNHSLVRNHISRNFACCSNTNSKSLKETKNWLPWISSKCSATRCIFTSLPITCLHPTPHLALRNTEWVPSNLRTKCRTQFIEGASHVNNFFALVRNFYLKGGFQNKHRVFCNELHHFRN
jgi:hypothetical protein